MDEGNGQMITAVKNYLADQMATFGLSKIYYDAAKHAGNRVKPWASILTPGSGRAIALTRVDIPINQTFFDEDYGGTEATDEQIALRNSYRRIVKVFDRTLYLDVTLAHRTAEGLDTLLNSFLVNLDQRIVIDPTKGRGYTKVNLTTPVNLDPLNVVAEIKVANINYSDKTAHILDETRVQIRMEVDAPVIRADHIDAITSVTIRTYYSDQEIEYVQT